MFFRAKYIVRDLDLEKNDEIKIDLDKISLKPTIEIRHLNKDELSDSYTIRDSLCTVRIKTEITSKNSQLFKNMKDEIPSLTYS